MKEIKSISVYVYSNKEHRNCDTTNGGITSKASRLILVWSDDNSILTQDEILEFIDTNAIEPASVLVLRKRVLFNEQRWYCEPFLKPIGVVGPMFGGNLVYTSDSRFPHNEALKVHDRFETPQEYELYSC